MRITVFTPAFNRGYTIETLYHSLQSQTFTDFEWLVVDDGSTDDTKERFDRICSDNNPFPVRYVKTENGGKHRAINKGVKMASGELFYIVDSDDYITENALQQIHEMELTIPQDQKKLFAGVCGQRGYSINAPIGTTFDGDILDITMLERLEHNVDGDKAEVFYTSILKKYPFPEFEGEKFLTECVVWDRIAADGYKLRFFNQITTICNYLEDGLTNQGDALLFRNPKGYALFLHQCDKYGKIRYLTKWNKYLQYYYETRNQFNFIQMSRYLHMNPVVFGLRILGMRLFYKMYNT